MATDLPPEIHRHVQELSAQLAQLQCLIKPRPRRWPRILAVGATALFATLTAYSLHQFDQAPPPVVAPIAPTGDAAQRLWLP